jgi:drug/metabolite transporter (DMT)-like permease
MDNRKLLQGYVCIILSAVIFGLMPLMASLIYADGVNSITLAFLRNLLSLPLLAVLAFSSKGRVCLCVKALPRLGFIALMGCCLTPLLLFSSYNYIQSGTATVFHFIYPAVVVLGEFIFLKSQKNRKHILCVLICMAGIALFYNPGATLNLQGSLYALSSGVTYAVYIIALSAYKHEKGSVFGFSFCVSAIASVLLFLVCLLTKQLALPQSLSGWLLSVGFACIVNAGAVALFQRGTFLIGGSRASILSTFEPITGVFAGILIFKESINPFTVVGTALVLLSGILIALFDMKKAKPRRSDEP